jgi:hypothetical protein
MELGPKPWRSTTGSSRGITLIAMGMFAGMGICLPL